MNSATSTAALSGTMRASSHGSRAMVAVLSAQFLYALADNALLFGALALLRVENYPA
jgi:hypothetical protein